MTVSRGGRVRIQVENNTKHDITLRNRTLLGQLYLVSSVTPLDVKLADQSKGTDDNHDDLDCRAAQVNSVNSDTTQQRYDTSDIPPHLSSINLEGLDSEQRNLVYKMLVQESDSFAKDGEIGNAEGLLLDINLEVTGSITGKSSITGKNFLKISKISVFPTSLVKLNSTYYRNKHNVLANLIPLIYVFE